LVRGVLDTGSDVTCVSAAVLSRFALVSAGQTTTHTAAGSSHVNLFDVSLSLLRPGGLALLVVEQLVVVELLNPPPGIDAFVGRDILSQLLFFHDGPQNEFTLGD
jgi:hypothetical protein